VSYAFDAANRRTSMTIAGQTAISYTYDNANRSTGITQGSFSVSLSYDIADRRTSLAYDSNGNVVSDGTSTYKWDAPKQLASLTAPGIAATFQYDTFGNRIAKNCESRNRPLSVVRSLWNCRPLVFFRHRSTLIPLLLWHSAIRIPQSRKFTIRNRHSNVLTCSPAQLLKTRGDVKQRGID
jgi:YD repeat-containing protein